MKKKFAYATVGLVVTLTITSFTLIGKKPVTKNAGSEKVYLITTPIGGLESEDI